MRTRICAALLSVIASSASALGPDLAEVIRNDDRDRLTHLDEVAGRTLRPALAVADPVDLDVLTAGLRDAPLPLDKAASVLPGDWSCRMLKLGRNLPLIAYRPFRCRIGADGSFQKLTGSQRMIGQIGLLEGRQTYVGTGFIAGDEPVPYDRLPEKTDPTAIPQRVPEVGVVEVSSPTKARILLPLPMLESDLNLLLLSR